MEVNFLSDTFRDWHHKLKQQIKRFLQTTFFFKHHSTILLSECLPGFTGVVLTPLTQYFSP